MSQLNLEIVDNELEDGLYRETLEIRLAYDSDGGVRLLAEDSGDSIWSIATLTTSGKLILYPHLPSTLFKTDEVHNSCISIERK